ncbi:TauD/TfdA family dioxygenase [Streptomyces sp. RG80]|uniref:TauD/TfdA family dioxygenase n=1 Tax=Streptomyces sp. RG80 TaxID=3157340 RepID=UPI00338FA81C
MSPGVERDSRGQVEDEADPAVVRTLDPDQARCLAELTLQLAGAASGSVDDPAWVKEVRHGWERFPTGVRTTVRDFRRASGPQGVLLLRGLPVGEAELPPTPRVASSVQRVATPAAALLVAVACGLGDPAAFRAEKSGALVQDVVPVPGQEEVQGNVGSARLSFHSENAFHAHRPDFVQLLCLRRDHLGVSGLQTACVRTVLPLMAEKTAAVLFEPRFITAPPPSFGVGGSLTRAHAVLTGAVDDPDLRVDLSATEALDDEAERALAELGELFERTAQTVRLRPGDLAIVDNRVTVHGRTSFRPRYDGRDRWLQRTFACTDLRRSRELRPGDGYVMAE